MLSPLLHSLSLSHTHPQTHTHAHTHTQAPPHTHTHTPQTHTCIHVGTHTSETVLVILSVFIQTKHLGSVRKAVYRPKKLCDMSTLFVHSVDDMSLSVPSVDDMSTLFYFIQLMMWAHYMFIPLMMWACLFLQLMTWAHCLFLQLVTWAHCLFIRLMTWAHCLFIQEIPRSRRGGVIQNYTLTVTHLNGDKLPAFNSCRNRDKFVVGGQNNTFLVKSLTAGGVYNVSVQANSRRGPPPTTWRILHVHSSPREYPQCCRRNQPAQDAVCPTR